jgi:DNA-binding GntR family transcriptional regulator
MNYPRHNETQTDHQDASHSQLEAAITSALLDGELQPGDIISGPDELSESFKIPLNEVLDSITHMLSQRILRQDADGNLSIHLRAVPTLDMRQQAFVMRARQLVDIAKKWDLPNGCIEPLLSRAAQHVA